MVTKLDCQRAFTLILLVCRPLDQAYRHGNEVGRERKRKRERDGVGCVGMAWPPSNTHTLIVIPTISNTQALPGNRLRFVQMGYYSDAQLYSRASSTLTTLSGQLKATTSLCLENNQDSINTDATKDALGEGFYLFVIHGSRKLHPSWKGPLPLVLIHLKRNTDLSPNHTLRKWDPSTKEPVVNWPFVKPCPPLFLLLCLSSFPFLHSTYAVYNYMVADLPLVIFKR